MSLASPSQSTAQPHLPTRPQHHSAPTAQLPTSAIVSSAARAARASSSSTPSSRPLSRSPPSPSCALPLPPGPAAKPGEGKGRGGGTAAAAAAAAAAAGASAPAAAPPAAGWRGSKMRACCSSSPVTKLQMLSGCLQRRGGAGWTCGCREAERDVRNGAQQPAARLLSGCHWPPKSMSTNCCYQFVISAQNLHICCSRTWAEAQGSLPAAGPCSFHKSLTSHSTSHQQGIRRYVAPGLRLTPLIQAASPSSADELGYIAQSIQKFSHTWAPPRAPHAAANPSSVRRLVIVILVIHALLKRLLRPHLGSAGGPRRAASPCATQRLITT